MTDWDVYLTNAWACGAGVFVVKTVTTDELGRIIHTVADGVRLFTQEQRQRIDVWQQTVEAKLQSLTSRQREVLELLVGGYTNAEMAEVLVVSIKTVESHVNQVITKLEVTSRREVIAWAQQTRALLSQH